MSYSASYRHMTLRRWLNEDQIAMLASRSDDPFVMATMNAIQNCHSEKALTEILVEGLFGLSRHADGLRRIATDILARHGPAPMVFVASAEDQARVMALAGAATAAAR